ncbi:DUF502 domain-containing protein [Rhodohalobacter halophilus]|uniref:DUF502 domain-containing protein n=1 Tax=Rhodohalobacter halophilus TaxID=1812810 RepID=UPI0009FFF547|nr:DUF502 domain-containing protein [Rhodohalobacter halophilus]
MMKTLLNYFLRGLLFIFPLYATIFVIVVLINWLDSAVNPILFGWLPFQIPGLGFLTSLIVIALLGFIISTALTRPIVTFFENLMSRIPFIKIIYTAFKDFSEAFLGDKKKFNKPVIVTLTEGVDRIGFITERDLTILNIQDRVAVYCPHSYNFSGNLFLVEPSRVQILKIEPSEAMKFAVSAGVTQIESPKK